MKTKIVFLLFFVVIGIAATAFRTSNDALFAVPKGWQKPAYNFQQNPLSKQKIELGRALFYDPILSRNGMVSCASCHSQYSAFTHGDHALSHGIHDSIGTRNAPALMNLAWQRVFMRDGAINHLDMQALAPISNPSEMGENITHVVAKMQATTIYPQLFAAAFGDSVITGERTLKAIAQFMLILVSSNAKYDSVMRKQAVFTAQERKGYTLFKKHCATCHTEPLFTNHQFMNNGLPVDSTLRDVGRFSVTQNPDDSLKFAVPTLRNIEFSYPYMHDGRFKRLSDVLHYYTAIALQNRTKNHTLAKELQTPIILSSDEKVDLTAFLLTLTDRIFLFNSAFSFPRNIVFETAKE
ncbi:MAG: cytochrome-c peroxidase [Candidatus Kapaibacterium sp.]|nr:MAG: cytochrome-c peroxidase [Candidatus Kapabacteria bacterium]